MEKSLDDYIKENPGIVKNMRHRTALTSVRFAPPNSCSQQWRLGRNGPRRPLKRLGRNGPLRPFTRANNTDGMPRLVRKYARFPPQRSLGQRPSVFDRLGWNPVFVLAKQRVRQARQYFWRRQQFYPSRVPSSFPMGRRPYNQMYRPMYRPNYQRRQFWQWGRPKFQKPVFSHLVFSPNDQNILDQRNDQLVKDERRRVQEEKLRNVQNNYNEEGAQIQMYQQGQHFNQQRNQPTLPDGSSAAYYPIARDEYASASNVPERAPSPEGSIISALAGMQGRATNTYAQRTGFRDNNQGQTCQINPFAPHSSMGNNQGQQIHQVNNQGQQIRQINNPFASQGTSMGNNQGQQIRQMNNPFASQNTSMGNNQGQQKCQMNNPFAKQNTSMYTGEQQMPHPYMANFRPNLPTGSMPLNQRFPKGDGYSHAQMNASMMV